MNRLVDCDDLSPLSNAYYLPQMNFLFSCLLINGSQWKNDCQCQNGYHRTAPPTLPPIRPFIIVFTYFFLLFYCNNNNHLIICWPFYWRILSNNKLSSLQSPTSELKFPNGLPVLKSNIFSTKNCILFFFFLLLLLYVIHGLIPTDTYCPVEMIKFLSLSSYIRSVMIRICHGTFYFSHFYHFERWFGSISKMVETLLRMHRS